MSSLEKACLCVLDRNGSSTDEFPVQFNPATMQLQMTNSIDGGTSRGRQTQQYNGTSSTTLTLDLEFDTADEGTTDAPVDVRSRTKQVAQFLLPGGPNFDQAPPRVKFVWGGFELVGTMASLTEDLSLFSSGGVPLRAKCSVSIKEQDPKFDANERGAGAKEANNPPPAGEGDRAGAGAPGTTGGGLADRAAQALAGETPADFLARNGGSGEAWRALGGALEALGEGVSLEAGASIEFSSSLSMAAGVGASAGFQAGLGASVSASLGLEASAGAAGGASATARLQQGFALSSAGGLTAAAETAKRAQAADAANDARASFGMAAQASAEVQATEAGRGAARRPLSTTSSVRTQPSTAAESASIPPKADPRATSYGRGVPLRDRVRIPGSESASYVVIGASSRTDEDGPSRRSTGGGRPAPWERIGRTADGGASATSSSARTRAGTSGCGRGCGGRGGCR